MNTTIATTAPSTSTKTVAQGVTFEMTLDSDSYAAGAQISATLILTVHESTPLALTFINGQHFDLEIQDAAGVVIDRWSTGKIFPDDAMTMEVTGVRKWTGSLPAPVVPRPPVMEPLMTGAPVSGTPVKPLPPQPIGGGVALDPVGYTLTGYLTTGGASAGARAYSATVAFTVHPRPVLEMAKPA